MFSIVAKARVKEGSGPQFEEVGKKLAAAVKANEPDCLLYVLTRSKLVPDEYLFIERYKDEAAAKFHGAQPHFLTLGAELFGHMQGPPELSFLDDV